jgi:hypothetical protein
VLKLRGQVEAHEQAVKATRRPSPACAAPRRPRRPRRAPARRARAASLAALARKFEESLDRLTDNRELISGIKAFLRMVRDPAPLVTTPPLVPTASTPE